MKYNSFYFRMFKNPMKKVLVENTIRTTPPRL